MVHYDLCCDWVRSSSVGFFFCKQKTAYDLRISDWSSDVCSSDLIDLRRRQLLELGQTHFSGQRLDRRLEAALRQAALDRHLAAFEADLEIGRAACRERVCQYV